MGVGILNWEDHWVSEKGERRVGAEGLWLFSAVDWWIAHQDSSVYGPCSKDNSKYPTDSV